MYFRRKYAPWPRGISFGVYAYRNTLVYTIDGLEKVYTFKVGIASRMRPISSTGVPCPPYIAASVRTCASLRVARLGAQSEILRTKWGSRLAQMWAGVSPVPVYMRQG